MKKVLISALLGLSLILTIATPCMAAEKKTTNKSNRESDIEQAPIQIVIPQNTGETRGALGAFCETNSRTFGIASNGQRIDFEGHGGMKLSVSKAGVTVRFYSHSSKLLPDGAVTIANLSLGAKQRVADSEVLKTFAYDKNYSIPVSNLADGTYAIRCHFKQDGIASGILCEGFFVKRGTSLKICRVAEGSDKAVAAAYDNFVKFMSGTKPEDNLRVDNLSYPSELHKNYHAADDLIKICDEQIIKHDDWSDELKVYAIVEWMRKNYAYDTWYSSQDDDNHKNRCNDSWSDPNAFITHTNVGVCFDFANVFVIMCRHLGIPACTINNDRHIWCAVYLNGMWVSIDPTNMVDHRCNQEDANPAKWTAAHSNYNYYGNACGSKGDEINGWHFKTFKD